MQERDTETGAGEVSREPTPTEHEPITAVPRSTAHWWAGALTAMLLGVVELLVPRSMLLLGRVSPPLAWLEVALLALYAAGVTAKLADPAQAPRWRRRLWLLFSGVFFAQLALGLLGETLFLMRPDRLHFPIPALILAGPIFRGEQFFMLGLFAVTVVLVGPAWCSYLCYFGAWDQVAADRRPKPRSLARARWRRIARAASVPLTAGAALLLRLAGASPLTAGATALGFGLIGVAVVLLISPRHGLLVHCTAYCPIGILATLVGRLHPLRIRIGPGCDECMLCRLACRYDALDRHAVARHRPNTLCTLCGDCLRSCPTRQIEYRLRRLSPARARSTFLALVVTLHAACLGLARI